MVNVGKYIIHGSYGIWRLYRYLRYGKSLYDETQGATQTTYNIL